MARNNMATPPERDAKDRLGCWCGAQPLQTNNKKDRGALRDPNEALRCATRHEGRGRVSEQARRVNMKGKVCSSKCKIDECPLYHRVQYL